MNTIRRWRALLLLLPFTILAGLLLAGCHGSEEAKQSAGYYNGPMKGKGAPTNDASGKSKGTDP